MMRSSWPDGNSTYGCYVAIGKGLRFGKRAAVLLRMLADPPETVHGPLLHRLARKCIWWSPKIQLFFPQANAEGGPGVVRGTILLNCAGGMNTKVVATFQNCNTPPCACTVLPVMKSTAVLNGAKTEAKS